MSMIEKAMSKAEVSHPNGRVREFRSPAAAGLNGARSQIENGGGFAPAGAGAPTNASLQFDYKKLRATGVIPAGEEAALRVANEYRRIKLPLLGNAFGKAAVPAERCNLLMVASSLSGEGKTHTAINLALSIAQEHDYTVLLIDGDVAKRDLSRMLGVGDKPGLLDLLQDDKLDIADVLLRTDIPTLAVLPAGAHGTQATEQLSSHRMRKLVSELAYRYPDRMIIFDSPPLLASVQAQVLAGIMGQIAMVVAAASTPQAAVVQGLETLDRSKPIGLILNKSRKLFGADYYGSGYYGYPTTS